MRVFQDLPKTSLKVLRSPAKTFKGRGRVSLVPRWISSWLLLLGVTYIMVQTIAGFFGYPNPINDFLFPPAVVVPVPSVEYPPNDPAIVSPSFYASTEGQVLAATQTAVYDLVNPSAVPAMLQPTFTPYPTSTPYPTQVKLSALGNVYAVGYSYYFPPFGPPNCGPENWHPEINFCDDMTASGQKWSEYMGIGVAIPIEWRYQIPLMSVIRVFNMPAIDGDYTVIDYCGDCIKPEGHIYFDFLDKYPRLAWTVPFLVEVVSLGGQ